MTDQQVLQIRGDLLKHGHDFATVAATLGVTRQHVGYVVRGARDSRLVWAKITQILGNDPRTANLEASA